MVVAQWRKRRQVVLGNFGGWALGVGITNGGLGVPVWWVV